MKVSGKKTGIHTNLESKSLLTIIIRTFNELLCCSNRQVSSGHMRNTSIQTPSTTEALTHWVKSKSIGPAQPDRPNSTTGVDALVESKSSKSVGIPWQWGHDTANLCDTILFPSTKLRRVLPMFNSLTHPFPDHNHLQAATDT